MPPNCRSVTPLMPKYSVKPTVISTQPPAMLTIVTSTRTRSVRMFRRIRREYSLPPEEERPFFFPFSGVFPDISWMAVRRSSWRQPSHTAASEIRKAPPATSPVWTGRKLPVPRP